MTDKESSKIEKYLLDGYKKPDYKLAEKIMKAVEKQIPKKPKTNFERIKAMNNEEMAGDE